MNRILLLLPLMYCLAGSSAQGQQVPGNSRSAPSQPARQPDTQNNTDYWKAAPPGLPTATFSSAEKNMFKFSPLPVVFGKVNLVYERRLNPRLSFVTELEVQYYDAGTLLVNIGAFEGSKIEFGTKLSPGLRYYPAAEALYGFYIQANLTCGYYADKINYDNGYFTSSSYVANYRLRNIFQAGESLWMGYQFKNRRGRTIDIGAGFQNFPFPDQFGSIPLNGYPYPSPDAKKDWDIGPGCPLVLRLNFCYPF